MTNHVGRLYALAVGLLVFFVLWVAIAAHPWLTKSKTVRVRDPRLAALAAREKRLKHEALLVGRITRRRWAVYGVQLRRREAEIKAARARYEAQLAAAQLARAQIARARALAAAQVARAPTSLQEASVSSTPASPPPSTGTRAASPSTAPAARPSAPAAASPATAPTSPAPPAAAPPPPPPEAAPPPPPPPPVVQDPPKTKSQPSPPR